MNFKNTSLYVQHEIDNILRNYNEFCRVYIDDIVIFNRSLKNHFRHLDTIFDFFNRFNISFSSIKFFPRYSSVQLLNLRINAFELSTFIEKLKAISRLKSSITLRDLKVYLKFTNWIRRHIFYYAQKFDSCRIFDKRFSRGWRFFF